jgi:type VI secretion system secreted protein VgrG
MSEHAAFVMNLTCSGLQPDQLFVASARGREEISTPFEFRVVVRPRDDVPLVFEDFEAIMSGTATLSFGPNQEHPIHGVIRSVELMPIGDGPAAYQLRFVPRFVDAQLTRGSWIHQEKTPREIITAAFALGGDSALREEDDFEFQLQGSYNPREYVVQYEESVFDFISRQAQHWGIFYFFDHLAESDRLVFGDMNTAFPQLEGFEEIGFEPRIGTTITESVRAIGARQVVVPAHVSLRDYNYRMPSVQLVTASTPVDGDGTGDVHVTGDHFWTPDEGAMLAGLRSQELFSRKLRMYAKTSVRGLRAGHRFMLTGAEPEMYGLAREYLVVSVVHHYRSGAEANAQTLPYSNEIELLPHEVAYRPPRVTPKPRIHGVMHAKIDAEADDDEVNVPCDEWGRYKVVMPFDVAGTTGGKATCWIRMATSAGGSGYGFAQGLHVNTEVVIFHIDGDPDRPVIAGAVSNFEQPAEVRQENANQLTMASRQGIRMIFHDAKP